MPTTYVPPGWDQWYGWEGIYRDADTKYYINENGQVVTYYRSDIHETDIYAPRSGVLRPPARGYVLR